MEEWSATGRKQIEYREGKRSVRFAKNKECSHGRRREDAEEIAFRSPHPFFPILSLFFHSSGIQGSERCSEVLKNGFDSAAAVSFRIHEPRKTGGVSSLPHSLFLGERLNSKS